MLGEVAATVLGGVAVFVFGQLVVKFFIEPLHAQSQLIGEISGAIILYANVSELTPEKADEAGEVFRQQASDLLGRTYAIPWYGFWRIVFDRPSVDDVIEASTGLIGLSNSTRDSRPRSQFQETVVVHLRLWPLAKKYGYELDRHKWWQF